MRAEQCQIDAGQLRHRITIQRILQAPDQLSESTQTPSRFLDSWAFVEPLNGRELFVAQQYQADITHRIQMRYRAGITSDMQVLFNGRVLNILSVINVQERNIKHVLMCKEVV